MSRVIVTTDGGRVVDTFDIPPRGRAGTATWRSLLGRSAWPMGWLGRALEDADAIENGRDPERLSEKAMRMSEGKS